MGSSIKKNIELFIPIEQIQKRIDSLHFGQLLYNAYFVKVCNVFQDFMSGQITEEILNKKRVNIWDNSSKMMNLASKRGCASDN